MDWNDQVMTRTAQFRKVLALAAGLGFPTGDPHVLKDGSNLLVHLRPAPVVARAGTATAFVRGDVREHFRRADDLARFLAGRGVPVVEPVTGPVRHEGLVVSFAGYVEHDPDRHPDSASFAVMLAELHAELRDYPGDLPTAAPLADIDAVLGLADRPARLVGARNEPVAARNELVAVRDELVARWPELPVQALHGDAHPRNVLSGPRGPVWNDFEDAWLGPVGWDVACAARSELLSRAEVARAYPADGLAYWLELRELFARCWQEAYRSYRTRTQRPA